jgi:hypothetical protein
MYVTRVGESAMRRRPRKEATRLVRARRRSTCEVEGYRGRRKRRERGGRERRLEAVIIISKEERRWTSAMDQW